ncbi:MAG: hypothetical protein M1484_04060 [Patescibacteria group bacterium]|nr:hypothetical protein [Patescibacteria group bacterium]MCL5432233.1 hypothetical protein [Patescibacteria group bacterium]
MISPKLFRLIKSQYDLPINSLHGLPHWKHVEALGRRLATSTKADLRVITLFAYLHDSCRKNDDFDPEHGVRAVKFVKELFEAKMLNITTKQLETLVFACQFHNQKQIKPKNITVATCWDADKLDLERMGTTPDSNYLFTEVAKKYNAAGPGASLAIRELAGFLLSKYNLLTQTGKEI